MTAKEIKEYGYKNFNREGAVFVFFAGSEEELPECTIAGNAINIGIAAIIDLKARTSGISFDQAIMEIRETRLLKEVDDWIRVSRKEAENGQR